MAKSIYKNSSYKFYIKVGTYGKIFNPMGLFSEGKNEKAIAILDKAFEIMPIENNQVAPDDICFYLCGNYYDAGAKEKGDALGNKLAILELEKIDYYQSLSKDFFDMITFL